MFKVTSTVLIALLLQCNCSVIAANDASLTLIAGYQTKTKTTGSKIDLDQAEIQRSLEHGDFEKAKQIYRFGSHESPYAKLTLEQPIRKNVGGIDYVSNTYQHRYQVVGMNKEHNQAVFGWVGTLTQGSTTMYFTYNTDENTEEATTNMVNHQPCILGLNPQTEGCLEATGGLVIEGYGAVDYVYNVEQDNAFWSSLWGFSEHEGEKMFHCKDKCPYPEYEKFYKYYGQMDYGVLWINAALDGRSTDFSAGTKLAHGNEDFSLLSPAGRAAAIVTATVTMNVRTHVNRIMTEWTIDRCFDKCWKENRRDLSQPCPEAYEPWDQAVATYVGSLEGTDGTGNGLLLYSMANDLCRDFATCGTKKNDIQGIAGVNMELLREFQSGQAALELSECGLIQDSYRRVTQLMSVPLIQGTLRSAYRLQQYMNGNQKPKSNTELEQEKGRAAAFVASILPDLNACNPMDATIVYNEMKIGTTPKFKDLKEALERNYDCLGITCEDIGGLYDADNGQFLDGAKPCGQRRTSTKKSYNRKDNNSTTSTFFLGMSRGFFICNVVIFAMLIATRQRWIPAVSSQVDALVSAGALRLSSQEEHEEMNGQNNDGGRYYGDNNIVPGYELSSGSQVTSYYPIPNEEVL